MTVERRDGQEVDPFRKWFRENQRLDSRNHGIVMTDCDIVVHRYKTSVDNLPTRQLQHLMWIEYKLFGKDVPFSQLDTLLIVDQLLRCQHRVCEEAEKRRPYSTKVETARREIVTVRSWGVHTLRLSGGDPVTSEWREWDGREIDWWSLEKILRFELRPDTMMPLQDRRHHHVSGRS